MKKTIFTLFIVAVVVCSVSHIAWAKEDNQWNDERIVVKLVKVERSDSFPDELKMPGFTYPAAGKVDDYFTVKLRIKRIFNVHLGKPGEKSLFLMDKKGNKYEPKITQFQGRNEVVEGSLVWLLYIIPKSAEPQHLHFVYPYWQTGKKNTVGYGEIVIDLPSR